MATKFMTVTAILLSLAAPGAAQQQQTLTGRDTASGDQFGQAIAADGQLAIIGAPMAGGGTGAAFLFIRLIDIWDEIGTIAAPASASGGGFGTAVSISGVTIAVAAPSAGSGGIVYVFDAPDGDDPKLVATLTGDGPGFGTSVALDGETLVVGSPHENMDTGAVYVFGQNVGGDNAWGLAQTLTASDAMVSQLFGWSVALDSPTLMVGAPWETSVPADGSVSVFMLSGSTWQETQTLTPDEFLLGEDEAFGFGFAVAIDGLNAVVGAYNALAGSNVPQGAAFTFVQPTAASEWHPQQALTFCPIAQQQFGWSVAISGTDLVVGAPGVGSIASAAYGFFYESPAWRLLPTLSSGSAGAGGAAVALSDTYALIGVPTANSGTGEVISVNAGGSFPVQCPLVCKQFGQAMVEPGDTATVELTLSNRNPSTSTLLTEIALTDALQGGLQVADPPNATTDCGTISATPGASSFAFSQGEIRGAQYCTVSVDVVAPSIPDTYPNATGPVTCQQAGPGAPSNVATLSVVEDVGEPEPSPTPAQAEDDGCAIARPSREGRGAPWWGVALLLSVAAARFGVRQLAAALGWERWVGETGR